MRCAAQVLAVYNVINFVGNVLGQQALRFYPPAGFALFTITALLTSLAAIPIALTRSVSPNVPESPSLRIRWLYWLSPVAFVACLTVGVANGTYWSLGPVYATDKGLNAADAGLFIAFAMIGGLMALWPLGWISDRMDRRLIVAAAASLAAVSTLGLSLVPEPPLTVLLALSTGFGAGSIPVYSVAAAHTADHAEQKDMVEVATGMILLYTIGASIGPLVAGMIIEFVSVDLRS